MTAKSTSSEMIAVSVQWSPTQACAGQSGKTSTVLATTGAPVERRAALARLRGDIVVAIHDIRRLLKVAGIAAYGIVLESANLAATRGKP
jgi:hypothetical protein